MRAVQTTASRTEPKLYVHKLRLEAREGGNVEIVPRASGSGWRLGAVTVGALVAASVGLLYYASF
jgi:hypothetical protein